LAGIPREELLHQVEEFATERELTHLLPMLQKGALVAQNPLEFDTIPELDEDDRNVLREEITHKWRQPLSLYLTVILCSVGAAVQGWDQTGSNGANLSFPLEFGIGATTGAQGDKDNWLVGLVNAAPYIGSAFMYVQFPSSHFISDTNQQ